MANTSAGVKERRTPKVSCNLTDLDDMVHILYYNNPDCSSYLPPAYTNAA